MADLAYADVNYEDIPQYDGLTSDSLDGKIDCHLSAVAIVSDAPISTVVSPASGVLDAQGAIVLDVTDTDSALRRVFLVMRIPALGLEELVHQGDRFTPTYAARSTRVAIADGFRYTINRAGGWPASPVLDVYPIDVSGQEG